MLRRFLHAKIRDIRISATRLEYEGSITLDKDYLDRTGILPDEEVQVLNQETGARFTTYVIEGEAGSRAVELNGPAARLASVGDRIMVLSYVLLSEEELERHKPTILSVDPQGVE